MNWLLKQEPPLLKLNCMRIKPQLKPLFKRNKIIHIPCCILFKTKYTIYFISLQMRITVPGMAPTSKKRRGGTRF